MLFLSALLYTSKMLADLPYIQNETAQVYHRLFEKWSRKIELPVVFHIVGTTWLFTRNLFDSRELMNIYLTRCRTAATESSLFFLDSRRATSLSRCMLPVCFLPRILSAFRAFERAGTSDLKWPLGASPISSPMIVSVSSWKSRWKSHDLDRLLNRLLNFH